MHEGKKCTVHWIQQRQKSGRTINITNESKADLTNKVSLFTAGMRKLNGYMNVGYNDVRGEGK